MVFITEALVELRPLPTLFLDEGFFQGILLGRRPTVVPLIGGGARRLFVVPPTLKLVWENGEGVSARKA